MSSIPFLDLITPHKEIEEELVAVFRDALSTGRFIGGPVVEGFEKDFASFCDAKYCIGVASGTDALRFALIAAGVKEGETVITVPNTFIATTEAISQAGANIDFVDINLKTYNMDVHRLQEYFETQCTIDNKTRRPINMKTKSLVSAIVPVHLYGQMSDMDTILDLAEKYNLLIIEDACQAHGAEYYSKKEDRWKRAGSMGLAAAFSFYPGKNLGAFGEAGAVTTNDPEIAIKIRMIRDHGQVQKYYHDIEGYNGRLDAIQAGILHKKLKCLAKWNEKRCAAAKRYHELFKKMGSVVTPYEPQWSKAVYHLYVIRIQKRDDLQRYLSENQIGTGLHYPLPLHLQRAYAHLGYKKGDFPVTEGVAAELLSLPMFPRIIEDQQKLVAEKIEVWLRTLCSM